MKTTLVLFGFFLALVQCHFSVPEKAGLHLFKKRPIHSGVKALLKPEPIPGQNHDCKPTDVCVANGGYCIRSKMEEDCNGLFFPKECKLAHCSCCVEDKDKCDSNPCGPNSHCQSTPGSYECVCDAGYEKVNGDCVDVNECDSGNNACLSNEYCANVPGSYTCTNMCDSNPCGPNSHCQSTPGSYECVCDAGYEKVNGDCFDMCDSNPCGPNSHCQSTPGSYECVCDAGYEKVNGDCFDVNECDSGNNACLSSEHCANVPGSYTCTRCEPGLTYLPVNDRCGKLLSGNMTYDEGRAMCIDNSLIVGAISTQEQANGYGEAFLPNDGDIAWIHCPPISGGNMCETLKRVFRTFYLLENRDCNVKMNAIICDNVGPV
ncbi:latent-transforming growth factor beta-binding protein 4-like isoform X2 [Macrobrachium nipponense]|uniref:latent-transforming growth factor beta-binding protein 4-like isoform X2 n=1 Tax=Macrobrachium nipponense TaxID=159736 RepID=UPI0030C8B5F7